MTKRLFRGDVIGEGQYGLVFKGHLDGELVAIKEIKPMTESSHGIGISAIREIAVLKELSHENIVGLKMIKVDDLKILLVLEYAPLELRKVLSCQRERKELIDLPIVKWIMRQVMTGCAFLHGNLLVHRDLKPSNVLITRDGGIKLADFGLTRSFKDSHVVRPMGSDGTVVTLWYRSPELILGAMHYTRAVDDWSLAAMLAEMLTLNALFMGNDDDQKKGLKVDQLQWILRRLGRPDAHVWQSLPGFAELEKTDLWKNWKAGEERSVLHFLRKYRSSQNPNWSPEKASKLINAMLNYDVNQRVSCIATLDHPFFRNVKPPHNLKNFLLRNDATEKDRKKAKLRAEKK